MHLYAAALTAPEFVLPMSIGNVRNTSAQYSHRIIMDWLHRVICLVSSAARIGTTIGICERNDCSRYPSRQIVILPSCRQRSTQGTHPSPFYVATKKAHRVSEYRRLVLMISLWQPGSRTPCEWAVLTTRKNPALIDSQVFFAIRNEKHIAP
jgi:hypothetical protein